MADLTISIIVPAYLAAPVIDRVLAPLLAMQRAGAVTEVIVADDCSPDETGARAAGLGARVVRTDRNGGPGAARNLAASIARGDILWFVDSDVIAEETGAGPIRAAFADPGVAAVFGSYDDDPEAPGWFSRYKNLMHRFYHRNAGAEASTFWAGCGAVRRSAFNAAGGFDADRYPYPSIEDIELGYRLRADGGRILILPELQAKHLKRWTMRGAVHTDVFRRAIPWSRLIVAGEGPGADLNTAPAERLRAGIAGLLVLSLLALAIAPALWPLTALLGVAALAANWRLFSFMRRNGGVFFALGALGWHQVYYLYASAAFAWVILTHRLSRRRAAGAASRLSARSRM